MQFQQSQHNFNGDNNKLAAENRQLEYQIKTFKSEIEKALKIHKTNVTL